MESLNFYQYINNLKGMRFTKKIWEWEKLEKKAAISNKVLKENLQ